MEYYCLHLSHIPLGLFYLVSSVWLHTGYALLEVSIDPYFGDNISWHDKTKAASCLLGQILIQILYNTIYASHRLYAILAYPTISEKGKDIAIDIPVYSQVLTI